MNILLSARIRVINLLLVALLALATLLAHHTTPARAAEAVRVNFQNQQAAIPAGYLRDYGLPFGPRSPTETGAPNSPVSETLSYGWIIPGTATPLDLSVGGTIPGNGRNRGLPIDQRLNTLMHMQADDFKGTFNGTKAEGAWELAVENGTYDVTVAAGDALASNDPESHTIRIEGVIAIQNFVPSGANGTATRHKVSIRRVTVTDGRLTIDAQGGTNTKISYIDVLQSDPTRPYVTGVAPTDGTRGVLRNISITATVAVPNGGIRADSVSESTVLLVRESDQVVVPSTINTTGGGDALTLRPSTFLDPNTTYTFRVTEGVLDAAGKAFIPFASSFTTGTGGGPGSGGEQISFEQVFGLAREPFLTSVTIGPDNRLYASSLTGDIYRYTINSDGTLSERLQISTVLTAEGGPRAIIGLAFDPAATADNLVLWITHNGPFVDEGAEDWSGRIARLSGPNLENFQNYVINLPHSFKDHMVNSPIFGPDGLLYLPVGSNSALGAPDPAWGSRAERLLSGSILRVNTNAITSPPLDVKTEDGGSYNPYAAGAAVTIYATGVRNAYDLVWHTNGKLYSAANGSAAGGNVPGTPANYSELAACQNRPSGPYTGPVAPALYGLESQHDFFFRIEPNGYYGHPNPQRCEWVLNGGNPTSGVDQAELISYTVGLSPDPNYRGIAYDFGLNKSPNGSIEYRSDTFNGGLKGRILVTRYSQGDDVIILQPGGANLDIVDAQEQIPGLFGLLNPLDLIEDRRNGNLYAIEFGPPSRISLLRPITSQAPRIQVSPNELVLTGVTSSTNATIQQVRIENVGRDPLLVTSANFVGANANQFQLIDAVPPSINGGESAIIQVAFRATSPGPKSALLQIATNAANGGTTEVVLRGLGTRSFGSTGEPSLQWVLDTYEIAVAVGDDNPNTTVINSNSAQQRASLLGDEIRLSRFVRADNANPVLVETLAVFGPTSTNPVVSFGWYTAGNAGAKSELFKVGNRPTSNAQRLDPVLEPTAQLTFDPGTASFGFYSIWSALENRVIYSEDGLNSFEGALPHQVRVYPLKNSTGAIVENAYVVAMEESSSSLDYQDVVVIVRNVRLASAQSGGSGLFYLPLVQR